MVSAAADLIARRSRISWNSSNQLSAADGPLASVHWTEVLY